jgi:hypothetical protein
MSLPQFDDLPFNARPDLAPYLIHLTKNTKSDDDYSAFDNLVNILKTGEVWGSKPSKGFIKGKHRAACFMDIPLHALKYVLTPENADPQNPRYEPYGILVTKKYAYDQGFRPVLYLSDQETKQLQIPKSELWRVVRFEVSAKGWICWLHEREWRCKGSFPIPKKPQAVLVKNTHDAKRLSERIAEEPKDFKSAPTSIIPLTIVSQGLLCR